MLVATGKIERPTDACLCCGSHMTTREFFGELPAEDRMVVADLEAGLNDLIWAQPGPEDVVLAVAEPSMKAVEIARRARGIAERLGVRSISGWPIDAPRPTTVSGWRMSSGSGALRSRGTRRG